MEKVKVKVLIMNLDETDIISPFEAIKYVRQHMDSEDMTISYIENFPYKVGYTDNKNILTVLNVLGFYNSLLNDEDDLNAFDAYFKDHEFDNKDDAEEFGRIIANTDYMYMSNPEHNEYDLAVDVVDVFDGPIFAGFDALVKYFDFDNYMKCVVDDPDCEKFADAVDNRDKQFLATYFDYGKYGENLVHSGTFVESKDGYVHFIK